MRAPPDCSRRWRRRVRFSQTPAGWRLRIPPPPPLCHPDVRSTRGLCSPLHPGPGCAEDGPAALLPQPRTRRALVRPPTGQTPPGSLARCARAGYSTVLWSRDSDDCRTQDPAEIVARLAPEALTPGEIVLMHECQPWTLAAL